jgi:hypothetical protein
VKSNKRPKLAPRKAGRHFRQEIVGCGVAEQFADAGRIAPERAQ